MCNSVPIRDVTKGFSEDYALRKSYQEEDFGLETVFVRRDWAEEQIAEIMTDYDLTNADVRLVNHISTAETGEKATWEIYVRSGKRLPVLF